jgi:hypothetical protein
VSLFRMLRDRSGVVAGAFGLMVVPEVHFLDAQWRVWAIDRGRDIGVDERQGVVVADAIPADVLERRITELLAIAGFAAS